MPDAHPFRTLLRCSVLAVLVLPFAGCAGESGMDRISCPTLGAGTPALVSPITALSFDAAQKGSFAGGWFVGYAFVPPPDVTITASLAGAAPGARALLMLYGPRTAYGDWGICQRVSDPASDGSTSLSVSITGGVSGELLLVVATQAPKAAAGTSFQLTLACEGACAVEPACPEPLAATCGISFCPTGFARDGDCPTCACETGVSACPPGFLLVAGACVDPCALNVTGDPVCGSDGQTWPSAQAALCAGVPDTKAGSCEAACGSFSCNKECGAFAVDPDTWCPLCECRAHDCAACPGTWSPVCGSDGVTWPNACRAACAGVAAVTPGECLAGCPMPTKECGDDFGYDALCPTCSYPPSALGGPGACALLCDGEECETKAWRAFPSASAAKKAAALVAERPCALLDCTKDADCAPPGKAPEGHQYTCREVKGVPVGTCTHTVPCDSGKCPAGRECATVQGAKLCVSSCSCPVVYDPVCALAGGEATAFDSACDAHCAGATIIQAGSCCKAREVSCKDGEVPELDAMGCRTGGCVEARACEDLCSEGGQCVHVLDAPDTAPSACLAHCAGHQVDPTAECTP